MKILLLIISIIQGVAILGIVGFGTWGVYHFLYDLCERKLKLQSPAEKLKDRPLKIASIISRVVAICLPIILLCAWGFAFLSYWMLNLLKVGANDVVSLSLYGGAELFCTVILIAAAVIQYAAAKKLKTDGLKARKCLMITWIFMLLCAFNLNSHDGNLIVHFFLDGAVLYCFWVFALRANDGVLLKKDGKNFSKLQKVILLVVVIAVILFPNMNMGHRIVDVTKVNQSPIGETIKIKNEPLYMALNYDNEDVEAMIPDLAKYLLSRYKLPCERGIDLNYLSSLPENAKVLKVDLVRENYSAYSALNAILDNYDCEKLVEFKLLIMEKEGKFQEISIGKMRFKGKKYHLDRLMPKLSAEYLAKVLQ